MNYKDFLPQPIGCGFYEKINSWKSRELKEQYRLFFMGLLLLIPFGLFAQAESEPNNDTTTADAITFGATGTGNINPANDDDYWQLTTTENGKIKVDFTHSGMTNQYTRVSLLSSTLQNLSSAYTNSSSSIERDGLAAGTYYIRVDSYYTSHIHGYSIEPSFLSIPTVNDIEPNGTFSDAQVLALNGFASGQVGYREYNDNPQDAEDWFSVTTTAEGRLDVSIETHINEHVYVYLYDGNGTTLLESAFTEDTAGFTRTISKDGLAPGQYFIRVKTNYSNDFAPYTLSNTLTLTPHPTEGSGNDTYDVADTFALNSSINGLIGYAYNGTRDAEDWYKITTNAEGKLQLTVETLRDEFIYVYLYDGNGTTQFAADYTQDEAGATKTISKDGLAPGDYYVRIKTYYSGNYSDFAPYILTNELILPPHPTEGSENDSWEYAQTLALNESVNGLVGYYYNGNRDYEDWYSVTTDANGKLQLSVQTLIPEFVYVYLYDGNGTSILANDYTDDTAGFVRTIEKDGLAPGEYYVRIKTYYSADFAPYILSNSLIEPDTPEDANDDANDVYTSANTLTFNTPHFGHIGYKYINERDDFDWYYLNWPADGEFKLNLKVYNGQNVYIQLYESNGTTLIQSQYTTNTTSINVSNLAAGTYYVRVKTYYSSEFAPYRISTGIDSDDDGYADVVDCAPDDATAWQEGTFYIDADGDGYHGVEEVLCYGDEAPAGYVDTTLGLDCDDEMAEVYPGAEEICDGIDNNCDGQIDEGVQSTWYADADGDGFGDEANSMQACTQPEGYVADNTDCDDTNAEINPNATELPGNGIDEDCDGSDGTLPDVDGDGIADDVDNCPSIANADQADLDEDGLGDACDDDADGDGFTNDVDCDDMDANVGLGEMWYADADGDGFGDAENSMQACTQPEGYVADNTDCDDTNAEINPNATEIAGNEIDENCDGIVETSDDTDGDGVADDIDNCLNTYNPGQEDTDSDGVGDACAECSEPYNVSIMRTSDTTATFTAGNAIWHYQGTANRAGRPLRARPMYGMTDMQVPHTQNALVPSFAYDTWFRTICPEGGYSDWVGPFYLPVFTVDSKGLPELTIYPNPTMGEIRFEKAKIKMVQVYDSNGAMMFEIKVENNHLDLTRLQSGTYNLILTDADGNKYQEQVIKK